MEYAKPVVITFSEELQNELELAFSLSCHCTMGGSRVCYAAMGSHTGGEK